MNQITSLDQLLDELPKCEGNAYVEIARHMDIPPDDLRAYAHFSDDSYTRNCILRTKDFELLLLCWNPDQKTPIHCHNGEECWVYLAEGKLREKRFKEDENTIEKVADTEMSQSRLSYMNDHLGFHSLHNIADGRSMSLHLYVSPIDSCRVYDEDKQEFVRTDLKYYSYEGKILDN
ncbi:MAG: cysteine dioxygenase family protein [Psychroflexus sp.]|nr:cysteine dioxygenase family protein [Psychroflexus sp.]MDN6310307.1 cysteine dioxygenase family protein [Psychroflexus sp.]